MAQGPLGWDPERGARRTSRGSPLPRSPIADGPPWLDRGPRGALADAVPEPAPPSRGHGGADLPTRTSRRGPPDEDLPTRTSRRGPPDEDLPARPEGAGAAQ